MLLLAAIGGGLLILFVLWDAFETVILPRRVTRRFRLTRFFYRTTWRAWLPIANVFRGKQRELLLSVYGPLSLPLLLTVWALSLIFGFALIYWAIHIPVTEAPNDFLLYLYLSGTTFFTLGYGDITPLTHLGRFLAVMEAGTGFGFLALVLGYLPVFYQGFSRREVNISLLDARAGSPPTAGELLRRHSEDAANEALRDFLREWEHWSADLMESHLSYPVLAYFRSQHDNQSWLAALTTILDTSALMSVGASGACQRQAKLTFAIARHAIVDLSQVFGVAPDREGSSRRLSAADLEALTRTIPMVQKITPKHLEELTRLRFMYEPYVCALSAYLRLPLATWVPQSAKADNWQTSAWERSLAAQGSARLVQVGEHAHSHSHSHSHSEDEHD